MNFQSVTVVYKKIAPYAIPVLLILFFFSLKTCQKYSGQVADYARNLDSVARLAKTFENSLGQKVAENQQIKVQSAAELKAMTDTIFRLKKADQKNVAKVTEYARIIQQFVVAGKTAVWDSPQVVNPVDTGRLSGVITGDSSRISVPKPFHYEDSTFRITGRVLFTGVRIDSLVVPNTVNYRIVTEKTGFLKLGRTSKVQVLNSNPAVQTTGVLSIVVPPTLTWWQRIGKPVAFAVLAAAGTSFLIK